MNPSNLTLEVDDFTYEQLEDYWFGIYTGCARNGNLGPRLRRVLVLWMFLGEHRDLRMHDVEIELLRDLWALLPHNSVPKFRRRIEQFVDRSPLIKLAECAE